MLNSLPQQYRQCFLICFLSWSTKCRQSCQTGIVRGVISMWSQLVIIPRICPAHPACCTRYAGAKSWLTCCSYDDDFGWLSITHQPHADWIPWFHSCFHYVWTISRSVQWIFPKQGNEDATPSQKTKYMSPSFCEGILCCSILKGHPKENTCLESFITYFQTSPYSRNLLSSCFAT